MSASAVGLRGDRGPILLALMVTTGLAALDSTIIATAVPSIVKDLGGFTEFPWLFSIYLLAQAVSVPIYAKLSDIVGRKPILLFGISLFLIGSIICGGAWNMTALIVARGLQGLGAGAILPMSTTIAGDVYTLEERAKVQGYIASVWGASSVIGPALGGVFSQFISWRWIFFVNIPLGIAAIFFMVRNFREKVERRKHKIDYLGAALLTVAISMLILAILEGGQAWAWNSPPSIAAFSIGGAFLIAFLFVERKAAEPILPFWVFSRRLLLTTTLVSFGVGAILLGISSYVPTYLQQTIGATPIIAGIAIAAVTIGWPIAAGQSGKLYLRIGFRNTVLIGMFFVILGAILLAAFSFGPSFWLVAIACFSVGLGLGLVGTPTLVAAQSSVPWNERGVVTGTNLFFRSVGSSVGVAIFGAVANSVFAAAPSGHTDPRVVETATQGVFIAVVIATAVTLAAGLGMPKGKPQNAQALPSGPNAVPARDLPEQG